MVGLQTGPLAAAKRCARANWIRHVRDAFSRGHIDPGSHRESLKRSTFHQLLRDDVVIPGDDLAVLVEVSTYFW
jgi:hypothetical protein